MPVPPSNPQDTYAAVALLVALAACLCVAYWRTALRVILIIVVALALYGAITGYEGLASLIAHR